MNLYANDCVDIFATIDYGGKFKSKLILGTSWGFDFLKFPLVSQLLKMIFLNLEIYKKVCKKGKCQNF